MIEKITQDSYRVEQAVVESWRTEEGPDGRLSSEASAYHSLATLAVTETLLNVLRRRVNLYKVVAAIEVHSCSYEIYRSKINCYRGQYFDSDAKCALQVELRQGATMEHK